jgi:methylated-DNA-[protein]-cysteine S-methyltransferase
MRPYTFGAAPRKVDDMNTNAAFYSELTSPVGELLLLGDAHALMGLYMHDQRHRPPLPPSCEPNDKPFREAKQQLKAYFAGKLRRFELELKGVGTPFQTKVWQALCNIPFGETESYGGLARRIGNANASRAVGLANGRNPIGIIVPCHRVVGASGALTGYGGGLERKQWLLTHEQRYSARAGAWRR